MSRHQISENDFIKINKPGCYTGGEVNTVDKSSMKDVLTRFAFCFPDTYEVGMSHLGLQILYSYLNKRDDVWCERAFMPWFDMLELLKKKNTHLFAIESGDALGDFDILGFTLQYEMSYTNILAMLDLAGIPLNALERDDSYPIICAGGPCATNPEPLSDFVDFFYIGDGEATLGTVMDIYRENKGRGCTKIDFLLEICSIPGIYVPRFYDVKYNNDGTLKNFTPNHSSAPEKVKRAFIPSLSYYPDKFIVPLVDSVHNRVVVEIARGCMRGCRFCQAGFIYRPIRERLSCEIIDHAKTLMDSTGHEEISLLALSACDHGDFAHLVDTLLEETSKRHVNISLPSTRLDAVSLESMSKVQVLRKSSLTVAPEAGSQKMRDIINKNLTNDDILEGCYRAFTAGYDKIKLYFMAGLPFEDHEDILAIATLAEAVVDTYYLLDYESRKRPVSVSVSTACFVPKPFTPFQWAVMVDPMEFIESQKAVKSMIRKKQINYRYHDAKTAHIEGVLARGDRRLGKVIETVYKNGAIFDGWSEHFSYEAWLTAFDEVGVDPIFYANRVRESDELLPWDFIDMGVTKEFLLKEWNKAQVGKTTPNCRDGCAGCGCGC